MVKSKVVIVWGSEDILSSYIELFLTAKEDWNVIRVFNEDDPGVLIRMVKTKKPAIVIICQGKDINPAILPLQRLLQEHPAIKVITINLESNAMDVYTRQKILVTQTSDLAAMFENDP